LLYYSRIFLREEMKTKQINVDGMSCGHCVETIENAVGQMVGVSQVQVSLENKNVSVDFDENQTSLEDIKGKIVEVGFETL
jgi:copper chaperone